MFASADGIVPEISLTSINMMFSFVITMAPAHGWGAQQKNPTTGWPISGRRMPRMMLSHSSLLIFPSNGGSTSFGSALARLTWRWRSTFSRSVENAPAVEAVGGLPDASPGLLSCLALAWQVVLGVCVCVFRV